MKLFEVMAEYQRLLDKDELSEIDELELMSYHNDIEDFAINTACYIRNLEAEYKMVAEQVYTMEERLESIEKRIASKNNFLLKILKDNQIKKITSCPWFVINIRKGHEKIDAYNKEVIPQDYYRRSDVYTLNKELIKDDIKKGIEVPGARIVKEDKLEIK